MSNYTSWMKCGDADCMADKLGGSQYCPCKSDAYRVKKIMSNIDEAIKNGVAKAKARREEELSDCCGAEIFPDDDYPAELCCGDCGEVCGNIHEDKT